MVKYRKGVFVVVYSKKNKDIEYLILKRKLHWNGWEFPKGGLEKGEKAIEVARREVKEETGLKVMKITNIEQVFGKYDYEKTLKERPGIKGQTYTLFSAEVKKSLVNTSNNKDGEHSEHKWVDFETALKTLTWNSQKISLMVAHSELVSSKGFRLKIIGENGRVLMGQNEEQNEKLVRIFMDSKNNIIMHTVAPGSPFGVSISELSNDEKNQMACLVASYSQDWRDNKKDVKVHYFTGKDIAKKKGMKTGTFGVRNTKILIAKKGDILKCRQ